MTSDLYEACMCMCMFLAPIAFLAYQIFGIVYLVENYMAMGDPCIGHLWPYVLVSLLACFSNITVTKNERSVADNCPALICIVLLNIGLAVWGGLELTNSVCQVMMDNHLWKFGLATFILQSFSAVLILIIVCCGILSLSITNGDRASYNEV